MVHRPGRWTIGLALLVCLGLPEEFRLISQPSAPNRLALSLTTEPGRQISARMRSILRRMGMRVRKFRKAIGFSASARPNHFYDRYETVGCPFPRLPCIQQRPPGRSANKACYLAYQQLRLTLGERYLS